MSRHLITIICAVLAVLVHRLWNVPSQDSVSGDTTAVILNWSRLENVIKIVSVLCQPRLEQTISQIFIWNNSPQKINHTTFVESKCPEARLRIFNSPSNMYFQARFFACEKSNTPYCFVQDDDYLIWPEIVLAMRSRISEASTSAIHLLPPHEMLSSQLRTISVGSRIHTSFAWLGHGTIMRRTMATEFMSLLRRLNATEDTMKMADNYFTILMNTVPETWFDQGVELGGGQPFTVGIEGDERNDRHIRKATQMLDHAIDQSFPFIATAEYTIPPPVYRAPCLGKVCIFETSINLFPPEITTEVSMAEEMLDKASMTLKFLSEGHKEHYLYHPPSHAVDGRHETCFQSPTNVSEGDWISLDLVSRGLRRPAALNMIVDEATEAALLSSLVEVYDQGLMTLEGKFSCETYSSALRLCKIGIDRVGQRYRLRLGRGQRWKVCEMGRLSDSLITAMLSALARPSPALFKRSISVQSLLHGSPEAKELEVLQHSRLVGRGKYVHGFEIHRVKPDKAEEYKDAAEKYYTNVKNDHQLGVKLTGSWEVVVGHLDTYVHILEYENYGGYDKSSRLLRESKQHLHAYKAMLPFVTSRSCQLNQEFAFFPSAPPHAQGGIFELRTYQLKAGTLLEWESAWRRGIEARRKFVAPVGAWFSQVGRLHEVHHMWQYPGLEARKETREKAWQIDGWAETVSKTSQLAKSMDSFILTPLSFSPLK